MSESLALLATHILVPALFALWMGKSQHRSRFEWILELLAFGTYTAFVFFTGRWGVLSIYLRYLAPLFLVIAVGRSGRRLRDLPRFATLDRREVVRTSLLSLILCLTLPLLTITLLSLPTPDGSVAVDFPLRQDGMFYVAEGGPHVLLNRRADKPETRYATLIQTLDRFGRAASGSDHPGEESTRKTGIETGSGQLAVYSPVDGVIEAWSLTRSTEQDSVAQSGTQSGTQSGSRSLAQPLEQTEELDLGNLTLRRSDGLRVVVGGMRRSFDDGAKVVRGDVLGTVPRNRLAGATGLWIYAFRSDSTERVGVPLLFAGTYLMRNYLYRSLAAKE